MGLKAPPAIRLLSASVMHARTGRTNNAFRYTMRGGIIAIKEKMQSPSRFISFNGWNLLSLHDTDHGDGDTSLYAFARKLIDVCDLGDDCAVEIELVTQFRMLGILFNPVSFWLFRDQTGALRAVVAEVNNMSGDRHFYLCARDDRQAIEPNDKITTQKVFHVSPFQPVDGKYVFQFHLTNAKTAVSIRYLSETDDGLLATLIGDTTPYTNTNFFKWLLTSPFSILRVTALIHWQALRLKLKGATYRQRPEPIKQKVTS